MVNKVDDEPAMNVVMVDQMHLAMIWAMKLITLND